MGIRDRLAAHDARFISLSDLLEMLADADNVTVQDAARALLVDQVLSSIPVQMKLHGSGSYMDGGNAALNYKLSRAVNGSSVECSELAQNELDAGEPGFFRSDVESALVAAGWKVPTWRTSQELKAESGKTAQRVPPDLLPFVPRVNVTLGEAATILAKEYGDGDGAWGKWWDALVDAVDMCIIQAGTWSSNRNEQSLLQSDIRTWCTYSGLNWPVPLPPGSPPATDEGLREALAASERDRADLKAKLQRMTDLERQNQELRAELSQLRAARTSHPERPDEETLSVGQINSPSLRRIVEAVEQYPDWRSSWERERGRQPQLTDIQEWQSDAQKKKPGGERLAYTAYVVILEHFKVK